MPFLPQIRRYLLRAFNEQILPDLRDKPLTQVVAGPPYDFRHVQHWQQNKRPLAEVRPHPSQIAWGWPGRDMGAGKFPFAGFVYNGTLDNKIGITQKNATAHLKQTGKKIGGTITVRLPAPGFIYFPPAMPGQNGTRPFCDTAHPGFGPARIIWILVTHEGALIHYCESDPGRIFSSHSLQIRDARLMPLIQLYHEEYLAPHNAALAQSLVYALAQRIWRPLKTGNITLANTSFPEQTLSVRAGIAARDEKFCYRVADYIENNLHGDVNREAIARSLHLSVRHLSRVFHASTGQSLMHYVTSRRVEAAKAILLHGTENITEISRLTGFSSVASFSGVFKKITGVSPKQFRDRGGAEELTV